MMKPEDKTPAEVYGYEGDEFQEAIDAALFAGRARREAKKLLAAEECPVQEPPDIENLKELFGQPREPTQFRIQNWFPCDGRVVIAAQAKAGKSTLTHNLIRSLVDGDRFLGRWKANPVAGTVAVLDFELSKATALDWLEEQDMQNPDKVSLCSMRGKSGSFNILDPATRADWAERLAEVGTDFLILDCLRPVLDALGLDEHKDAGKFLNAFDALLREGGIAEGAVVQHMGHGTGEGWGRSRGDSRIIDWPDATWRLALEVPGDQQSTRFIRADGRDVVIPEHQLELYDKRRFKALASGGDDREVVDATKAILSVLAEYGEAINGRTIENELKETDHPRKAIRDALRIGVRRGTIEPQAGPHNATLYSLPQSWVRRAGGGHGDEDGWGGTIVE
jgi:hypothetical protein